MDAIQVVKVGWRALDANGNVIPGAMLVFEDAGTTNPREVFADFGLSVSLGVTVTCDAGGYPASDANAKIEIYTGSAPYRVTLQTPGGVTVWSHDNVVGALDTSGFLTDPDIVPSSPITNTASNQEPQNTDKGRFYNVNCSGGDVMVLLDGASDLLDGWFIKVRHDGTANAVRLVTTGGELMKIGSHAGLPAFALTRRGQTVSVTCDGVGFKVEETSPALFAATGVILVADRLATAPGGALSGARYIATADDDWGSLAVSTHDVVEADGQGGWFRLVPPVDGGWLAYVQDEDDFYVFKNSAWSTLGAVLLAVASNVANQAQMEAAAAADIIVPPGRQHFHPGHAKAWANVLQGTTAIVSDYGVASVADNAAGIYTLTFDTAFSSTNAYTCGGAFARHSGNAAAVVSSTATHAKTTTTYQHFSVGTNDVVIDSTECGTTYVGDQ